MLRDGFKYILGLVVIVVVMLVVSMIIGCDSNKVEYPIVDSCHEDCRIVFHMDYKTPCRDISGNQLNLAEFEEFHRNIVRCDTTSPAQKQVSSEYLDYYYDRYNISTMLSGEDTKQDAKQDAKKVMSITNGFYKPISIDEHESNIAKQGNKAWQAVIIGILCGLVFGFLVFLPMYIDLARK